MIEKRTWEEFRKSGLAWWINRILHTFGWAIVFEVDKDAASPDWEGPIKAVYPARCSFRGFGPRSETEGFRRLTEHIEESLPKLKEDLTK